MFFKLTKFHFGCHQPIISLLFCLVKSSVELFGLSVWYKPFVQLFVCFNCFFLVSLEREGNPEITAESVNPDNRRGGRATCQASGVLCPGIAIGK
jgi:hypothetical protein